MLPGRGSGNQSWADATVQAVNVEIPAIHGKDCSNSLALCDANQRGVGEIHRPVRILAHEFTHPSKIVVVEREKSQLASVQHFPDSFLALGEGGQVVHCLRKWRPYGRQRLAEALEDRDTRRMVLVGLVNERDKGPGINQDQVRLRRSFRNLANLRPMFSELCGSPLLTTPMRSFMSS